MNIFVRSVIVIIQFVTLFFCRIFPFLASDTLKSRFLAPLVPTYIVHVYFIPLAPCSQLGDGMYCICSLKLIHKLCLQVALGRAKLLMDCVKKYSPDRPGQAARDPSPATHVSTSHFTNSNGYSSDTLERRDRDYGDRHFIPERPMSDVESGSRYMMSGKSGNVSSGDVSVTLTKKSYYFIKLIKKKVVTIQRTSMSVILYALLSRTC